MTGRMRLSSWRGLIPGTGRVRGAAGYVYLAYFLALPLFLIAGPWVAMSAAGQSVTVAIKTTAGLVGAAYVLGLLALFR